MSGSAKVRYKGHEELLRAIARVRDSLPAFRIEMIGPGDTTWIKKLAISLNLEEHLILKGKLRAGKEVTNWLESLDIYVHPSKQEGLPRSVIEAMSKGLPVLASSVAGIPELIESKYLHKPGDYTTLGKQLISVLLDPSIRKDMSQTNFSVSKKYDSSILESQRQAFWKRFASTI